MLADGLPVNLKLRFRKSYVITYVFTTLLIHLHVWSCKDFSDLRGIRTHSLCLGQRTYSWVLQQFYNIFTHLVTYLRSCWKSCFLKIWTAGSYSVYKKTAESVATRSCS